MQFSIVVRALLAVLVLVPGTALAQRFDVVTFDAPPGWTQQALGDGLMFEMRPVGTRTFCRIVLQTSRRVTASLPQELDRAWTELRERQLLVAVPPDPAHLERPGGITIAQRLGHTQTGSIVVLNLVRKDDRLVPVVVTIADTEALDRCGPAAEVFMEGLRLDATSAATEPATTGGRVASSAESALPISDPKLAARFGNSVVGTWRYALTAVTVTLNAPSQIRNVIEIRFDRGGTYSITVAVSQPGGGGFNDAESGTYRVEGQRLLLRPADPARRAPYRLDWFFGDHPDFPGNWGLILRSNADWLGSFGASGTRWRTFKPAE